MHTRCPYAFDRCKIDAPTHFRRHVHVKLLLGRNRSGKSRCAVWPSNCLAQPFLCVE